MKALMSVTVGGPETLEIREAPTPQPGKGQVLIAVKAASVNFPDTLIIRDLYQFKAERPFAPGTEIAGVIEAVGEGVERLSPGQRVSGTVFPTGGFATHVVIDQNSATPIPDSMDFDVAAAFAMTYGTSYYALKDRARLQAGETLLVLGAAGGVGSAAVELGKVMGAKVVAAVSSEEKAAFCRELGADETIVYSRELDKAGQKELSKAFKEKTGGGADVIYDAVGGDYAEPAVRALNWEGRFLVVGFPAGIPALPLNLTLLKSCQVMGVFWGAAIMRDFASHLKNMGEIFDMITSGKITPRVTARYPLAEGGKALAQLESRAATGKIVLTMD